MSIAKGRTSYRAEVEDLAILLESLTCSLREFYTRQYQELPLEDDSNRELMIESIRDLERESLTMLVVKVYSYAESYLKRVSIQCKEEVKKQKKESYIQAYCKCIAKHLDLENQLLQLYWPQYTVFHRLRNDIVHQNKQKKIDVEFIIENIHQIENLLLAIELK